MSFDVPKENCMAIELVENGLKGVNGIVEYPPQTIMDITEQNINTAWHFPLMILASFVLFYLVIRLVLGKKEFREKIKSIFILSLL